MEKEQLLALLAQIRKLAEKAEEQVTMQRETVRSMEWQGINSFQARAILGSLEETLDFYLARMDSVLNQLDIISGPDNDFGRSGEERSAFIEVRTESR